jgi:hypothetical protein
VGTGENTLGWIGFFCFEIHSSNPIAKLLFVFFEYYKYSGDCLLHLGQYYIKNLTTVFILIAAAHRGSNPWPAYH